MSAQLDNVISRRQERFAEIRSVLVGVLVANILVTLIKIAVGMFTGILAIVADGFHSLVDASSNLIGLAVINLARKPKDKDHPYGYQRYETLGAFIIGIFMLLAAWEITNKALENFRNRSEIEVNLISMGLMILTFVINLAVVYIETRAGNRLKSAVLLADARHTQTDLYITASVVLSMIGMWLGFYWLDTVVAVIVVALIIKAAVGILLDASRQLADKSIVDLEQIAEIVYTIPHIRFVHHIRSRGLSNAAFVDLHIKVDAEMTATQAHSVASEVERRLIQGIEEVKEVLVHVEPASIARPTRWQSLSNNLRNLAESMGLGLHDLHIHAGDESDEFTVELHLEFEAGISLGEAHCIADKFEETVLMRWGDVVEVITHLEPLPQKVLHFDARSDPGVEARVVSVLDDVLQTDQLRSLQLYYSGGHLHAVIVVCLDENTSLTSANDYADKLEVELRRHVPQLDRVTLHVEPYRNRNER